MQVVDKVHVRLYVDKRTKLGAKEVWFPPAQKPTRQRREEPTTPTCPPEVKLSTGAEAIGFSQKKAPGTGASAEDENPKLVWGAQRCSVPGPLAMYVSHFPL